MKRDGKDELTDEKKRRKKKLVEDCLNIEKEVCSNVQEMTEEEEERKRRVN